MTCYLTALGSFLAGAILTAMLCTVSPKFDNLATAQSHYTRCLSDGGTPAHCAETYLLPTKEVT
jgi:hypothetical protein